MSGETQRTGSAEAMLEQLRVNNGAAQARINPADEEGVWRASITWSDARYLSLCPIHGATSCFGQGASLLAAVDDLAAKIPGHREKLRTELPELIKRLRALAKVV